MRESLKINRNWEFSLPNQAEPEIVCLPHTVKLTPANSCGGRNYQGLCTYEKEILIEKEKANGKVFIEFEGAMGRTALYVNDRCVKEHLCGYIPLVADITDYVFFGENNRIVVELDNRDNEAFPPGKTQGDLDFAYHGGLYREAKLVYTSEKVYITNPLLANEVAGGGIFAHYENISEKSAVLKVKTHIQNDSDEDCEIKLVNILTDENGTEVAKTEANYVVEKKSAQHFEAEATVENPIFWDIHNPYIYMLHTRVYKGDTLIDNIDTQTGIRTVEFTLGDGTIFNGKKRRIHGANYHQTYPYIENGVPINLLKRDFLKLKDCGMENIRSHYPFTTELVQFCNEIGMTLIVANVGWQFFKEGKFFELTCQNMRNIIRWHRNNPSVIIWEPILNESKIDVEHQTALANLVHEEYPFEGTYSASDYGPTDVAYNEFDPVMLGKGLEEYGVININDGIKRPKWIREYGDGPDNFVDQNSVWRSPRGFGEHAMIMTVDRMLGRYDREKGTYTSVLNNKANCGFGVWPGIEHNRGYHINPCWGGYLDAFRIPKYAFSFMKSQQDREKIGDYVFIANAWSEISPNDVTVYSNAEKVRLYHNDELVAEQEPDNVEVKHPPFTFKDVRRNFKNRARATLRAEAIVNGKVVAEAKVMSPGVPKFLKLEADFMGMPLKADGADIVTVYCKITDREGNLVPNAGDNHLIKFEIEGEGEIVGDDTIGANPIYPELGIATILVKSTGNPGKIKVTARQAHPQTSRNYIQFAGEPIGICDGEIVFESIQG